MTIRQIEEKDIKACLDIYNYYVENTCYTLEIGALSYDTFRSRVHSISSGYPYLVCESEDVSGGTDAAEGFKTADGMKVSETLFKTSGGTDAANGFKIADAMKVSETLFKPSVEIQGYAYIHEFSPRAGYRYTVEITVYVKNNIRSKGIGSALTKEIISLAKELGYKNIISVVTSENLPSLKFHEKMGFENKVCFEGIAEKFGRRFGVNYLLYEIK